jgi:DNA-binding transcriptional MerR regulator
MTHGPSAEVPAKLFYRIGEVAGLVGVEPHVLRYWEREFRAIRPTKSSKGQRVYSRKDVENLLRVRGLLYEEGFTIAGAKKKLARPFSPNDLAEPESSPEPSDSQPSQAAYEAETPSREPALALVPQAVVVPSKPDGENCDLRASLLDLRSELERLLQSIDEE